MMSRDGLKCEQLTRERWWATMKVRYTIPYSGADLRLLPEAVEIRRRMGLNAGDILEIREAHGDYVFHKHVQDSPFDSYVGYLKADTTDTDNLINDMRGSK